MDPQSGTAPPPSWCRAVPLRRHRDHGRRHRRWLLDVSPGRALLIPAATRHRVRMLQVSTRSLYIEQTAVPWWPATCTVVDVPPLLRELLLAAVEFEPDYGLSGRDGHVAALLLHEIAALAPLPFHIGLPASPDLAALCRAYLAAPDVTVANASWATRTAVSERAFTRRFRRRQERARPVDGPARGCWRHSPCCVRPPSPKSRVGFATPRLRRSPPPSPAPAADRRPGFTARHRDDLLGPSPDRIISGKGSLCSCAKSAPGTCSPGSSESTAALSPGPFTQSGPSWPSTAAPIRPRRPGCPWNLHCGRDVKIATR